MCLDSMLGARMDASFNITFGINNSLLIRLALEINIQIESEIDPKLSLHESCTTSDDKPMPQRVQNGQGDASRDAQVVKMTSTRRLKILRPQQHEIKQNPPPTQHLLRPVIEEGEMPVCLTKAALL